MTTIAVLKAADPLAGAATGLRPSAALSAAESEPSIVFSCGGAGPAGTNGSTSGPSGLAALDLFEKPRPVATTRQEQRQPAKTKGD